MVVHVLKQYRSHIYLALALASVFGLYTLYERRPQREPVQLVTPTAAACAEVPAGAAGIRVHVVGAVAAPGVYMLAADARVVDAVQAAGGLTDEADQEGINLADRVGDGQQIRVPRRGSEPGPTLTPLLAGAGGPNPATAAGSRLNLNTASASELERLPGIGPALAQRIVTHRQEKGLFRSVEEIVQVSGIGEAIYARIRDLVTVD